MIVFLEILICLFDLCTGQSPAKNVAVLLLGVIGDDNSVVGDRQNIDEMQAQVVELHKRFSTLFEKSNDIGGQLSPLNKSFNAAVGSAQSRLLPKGRCFADLAGHSGEIDLSGQIDEVVRRLRRMSDLSSSFEEPVADLRKASSAS